MKTINFIYQFVRNKRCIYDYLACKLSQLFVKSFNRAKGLVMFDVSRLLNSFESRIGLQIL